MAGLVSTTVLSQTLSERVRASGPYKTEVVVDYPAPDAEPDFPLFKEGERYVLLLKYTSQNPNPMLEYGGQSAFKIDADTSVRQASLTHGRWTRERGPVALDGFLREVREVIGRNR